MAREQLVAYIAEKFNGRLKLLDTGRYDPLFLVQADDLLDIARALKEDDNLEFDFLCNLMAIDTGEHFEVVYNVASIARNLRLDLKIILPYDAAEVESAQRIWPASNWYEREM